MQEVRSFISAPPSRGVAMVAATAALGALYIVSTMVTPLYPLYEQRFHFSELVVTEIYASYLIGNLAVLFLLGRLSDQIGRRPTTLAAFGIVVAATLAFLGARSAAWLFVARGLSGLAAGLGAGTLTAWIAELEPRGDRSRAAVVASVGNLAGLAAGSLLAGLVAHAAPWPLRTSFVVYLAILAVVFLTMSAMPETVERRARSWREVSLLPRIGVPRDLRLRFVAPAAMAFASFALGGFYAALVPGLLGKRMHLSDVAIVGAVVALFFGGASAVSGAAPIGKPRATLRAAVTFLFVSVGLLVAADVARSFLLLIAATLASGAALAFGYRGSLRAVNEMAPKEQRAELVSTYLLVCYTANALPVLGIGWLGKALGASLANIVFAAFLAALGVVALVAGACAERRRAA